MKKRTSVTMLAIILLVTIVAASLVASTYARYANTVNASATATSAAWSFEAGLGDVQTTTIDLADTLTGTYDNLKADTIAPGTSGSFDIVLNASGSEVGVKYSVAIAAANGSTALPDGLTFEIDGTTVTSFEGYIALASVETPVTKTVTWEWVIGDDAEEETGIDNENEGQSFAIDVKIRGEQHIGAIS